MVCERKGLHAIMMKVYKEEILIHTTHSDVNGQWKPSAILECMQEAAGVHGELIGVGRNALLKKNVVWVLTRIEVVMDRYPHIGERITVETFPMPVRRFFYPRYFIFRDEHDVEIGRAGSLWALLDINSHRMASPADVKLLMPDNSDLLAPLGLPATVTEVSGTIEAADFAPVYTDLDVNGHVNNTKYMDWCCNALGIDTMRRQCFARFALNYDMELLPGQEVHAELRRLGNDFSYCGFHAGKRHFDIGGVLTDRVQDVTTFR